MQPLPDDASGRLSPLSDEVSFDTGLSVSRVVGYAFANGFHFEKELGYRILRQKHLDLKSQVSLLLAPFLAIPASFLRI